MYLQDDYIAAANGGNINKFKIEKMMAFKKSKNKTTKGSKVGQKCKQNVRSEHHPLTQKLINKSTLQSSAPIKVRHQVKFLSSSVQFS